MNVKRLLLTIALGGLLVGSAVAQTSNTSQNSNTSGAGPGKYDPHHPRVNQVNRREQRQQNRVANGLKSGQLTPKETTDLEKRENRLANTEKRDMAKDKGHLTKKNQAQLNRQANRDSRAIYRDKHNDATR